MKLPDINIPRLSDHGSEIVLLGLLGCGVLVILWRGVEIGLIGDPDKQGLDVAAFLLVLQRIVEAVQKRWEQRSVDRMGASLANAPPSDPPAPTGETKQ